MQICGAALDDIRDRQWDGIHYHFSDYENGRLEFYCRDVEVLGAQPVRR